MIAKMPGDELSREIGKLVDQVLDRLAKMAVKEQEVMEAIYQDAAMPLSARYLDLILRFMRELGERYRSPPILRRLKELELQIC